MKCERCGYEPGKHPKYSISNGTTKTIPEYRFGGPRDKILKYLEQVGMLPTTAKLMHECGIGGLHDAGCALDELLEEGLIGKVKDANGVVSFFSRRHYEGISCSER